MKRISLVYVLLSALLAACSSADNFSSSNTNISVNKSATYSNDSTSNTTLASAERNPGGGNKSPVAAQQVSLDQADKSQTAPVPVERKIIRNAELTLEADVPDEAQDKINAIAESKGGFVIESQKQSSDTKATKTDVINLTVRVPSAKFDEALAEIRKTASRVILENVKGQDVTEEFIDIEARLKTQKALEAQFLEIMKQAKTVEDALNVQREIAEVRAGIEKIEGRKRFLENQSEFSTLKIRLQAPTVFSASSSGFFYQLGQAFSSGFSAAMSFVLLLVTMIVALLPFLVFIVLPTYLVIRYFLRKRRRQKLASEIAQAEIKNG
jgi:hypothetical protein